MNLTLDSTSQNQFKHQVVQHLDTMGYKVIDFFKSMPHFKSISLNDRITLLPRSFFRICMAESVYEKNQPMLFGMNVTNARRFLMIFPEANVTIPEQKYLSTFIQQWKPSKLEFALFLHLVFFADCSDVKLSEILEDAGKIVEIRQNLEKLALNSLTKQFGGDRNRTNERLQIMLQAAKVISDFSAKRRQFFGNFVLKNPDIRHSSATMEEFTK